MLGYDFEILYKKGISNRVADALSRQLQLEEAQLLQMAITTVISSLLTRVKQTYKDDAKLAGIIGDLQQSSGVVQQKYTWDG